MHLLLLVLLSDRANMMSLLSSRSSSLVDLEMDSTASFFAKVAPAKRARRWGLSKRRLGDESSLKKLAVRGLAGRAAWHCARIEYRE